MSKKDQHSKYLASFYNNPDGHFAPGTSGSISAQKSVSTSTNPPAPGANNPTPQFMPKGVPLNNSSGKGTSVVNPDAINYQNLPKTSTGSSGSRNNQFMPKVGTMPSAASSKPFLNSQKSANNLKLPAFDADKFKKPGDFFKSSQSTSSQFNITSSQSRVQFAKRTSFGGGGSTHEMLSQSFQGKKPNMGGNMVPSGSQRPIHAQAVGPRGGQVVGMSGAAGSQMRPTGGPKPPFGFNAKVPVAQRKSHIVMDKDVASTNALQLQWTQKMCQKKDSLAGSLDKRNLTRNEGKSPLGKSFWADSSISKSKETCANQQNDPWYSNDVWGDDLPEEAVDACLQLATQKAQQPRTSNDPLSSWMDETWASPKKSSQQLTRTSGKTSSASVKTSLFSDSKFKPTQTEKTENLMDLLAGDEDFLALVDKVESHPKPALKASKSASSFSLSGRVLFPSQQPRPTLPLSQVKKVVPLSECMPVGTGSKSSFVIKAKEYESPSKQETLTHSQRTFRKPVKSLPSPSSAKMSFTTEWLRGQLEKISSEYTTLKEDVQLKEGESKLLREKLKTAEEEAQKHKLDKARELEKLRQDYEAKVKLLEKQLEASQTQAMFKAKEAESSLEKYRELKNLSVLVPEPAKCPSFKNIPSIGPTKPAETTKAEVLADETTNFVEDSDKIDATTSADFVNDTINIFETPKKLVEPLVEGTPEKSMFEDSPVKSKEEIPLLPSFPDPKTPPKTYTLPKTTIFDSDFIKRNEVFKKAAAQVVHGNQPKKELNHFLMPPMEYLPHTLLQTEFSEQDVENYLVRRPTLVELWGVPYDAFGAAVLDEYEKAAVGDMIQPDPARIILSRSRYFSSMESVHGNLVSLAESVRWGPAEWKMAQEVVDLGTKMVRELYATLGDPRLLQTTYTIYDRDPKILSEFLDSSELMAIFDPLSPEKWKNESFVELRRCLVMIGFLCSIDHMMARYIINPKSYNSSRAREFYPTSQDLSQASRKSEDDNLAVRITIDEGERKPSELKLMQMYRDLHSKKLTLAADLANSFTPGNTQPARHKITFELTVPMEVDSEYKSTLLARIALQSALENFEKNTELRSGAFCSRRKCVKEIAVSFSDFKECVSALGLSLEGNSVQDVVGMIQGDLKPEKVKMLNNVTTKIGSNESTAVKSYHVRVPERLFKALKSDVLGVSTDYGILGAPVDRCISLLEKQMMQLALLNTKSLKNIFDRSIGEITNSDLDLTRYVSSCADADDYVASRKRKISVEDTEPRKAVKVADYKTPPFDKALYSQIQKEPEEDNVVVITETQPGPTSSVEDDQLAKFEKREEMAELKRKMLAEEKKESKRHALAPVRIPGRNSPTNEDSADREVAMEIEKMFQTQVRPDLQMEESVWASEAEEDESDMRTLSTNEDDVVIEVIPELVKHFHNKLENAGLLELLCEVFKEAGVLRFTHRLNGVMLGTVIMLQKIVMYQRKEVETCQSKLATLIREILYTRPSPRIVLEVNILLHYAVTLPGFPKMLCHNASPETFVTSHELVYFTRGACLLEVVCILVTYATEEDTDYSVYLEMIHWVYYIICTEKKHMASLYEQHNSDRRRCMCITALNNTMVMIFHRALSLYRRLTDTHTKSLMKRHLEKIFVSALQVLRLVYTYGALSFLYTIRTQYLEYRQLLTWLREMHNSAIYREFRLSQANMYIVSELLKDTRDPNNLHASPDPKEQPNLDKYFSQGKPWPYDVEKSESAVKDDSSDSEDE